MNVAKRVSCIVAAWLLILIVANSCGGDKTPSATPSRPEASDPKQLAQSMLLTRADFPAGWIHKAADPEPAADATPSAGPAAACFVRHFDHEVSRAVGGEWSDHNTTLLSINPTVFVFDNDAHAAAGASAIIAQLQCFADTIGDGLEVDDTFGFGPTHTEPIDAAEFGGTRAVRAYNTQIYKTQSPRRSDVLVFDAVVIVEGRVAYEVVGFQRHSPIDGDLLRTYVEKARQRIVQPRD